MKKNKINKIFLIIPLFILLISFVSPVQAEKVCCELRGGIHGTCEGRLDHQFAEGDCSKITKPGCVDTITVTDLGNCKSLTPVKIETKPSDPIIITPQVSIPGSNFIAGKGVTVPESTAPIAEYLSAIFKYSAGIIGIISAIVMMYAGVRWITAGGNPKAVSEAKTYIASSLSGLALTLGAFLLLSTINLDLVNFKIDNLKYIKYEKLTQTLSAEELKINTQTSYPPMQEAPVKTKVTSSTNINSLYSLLKIPHAYAQSGAFFDPPGVNDFNFIVYQCGDKGSALGGIRNLDYSKSNGSDKCQCTEDKITNNEECGNKNSNYSTICSSGCGMVSMFMVILSYFPSLQYSQDSADYFLQLRDFLLSKNEYRICDGGTKQPGLIAAAKAQGWNGKEVTQKCAEALLRAQYPVIASLNANSPCTDFGHVVALANIDGNEVLVRNPSKKNEAECQGYQKWPLSSVNYYLFLYPEGKYPKNVKASDCL
ncbi:MAG: hypothetical protein NTY12_04135 [Candidatus Falkowbacteria bacterium]|nr:hypothetical protein [Candidatus Falkowbacteria bacterium]